MANASTENALDFSSFGTKVEPTAEPLDFSSFGTKVNDGSGQPKVAKSNDVSERGFVGRRVDDLQRGFSRAMQGIDVQDLDRRSATAALLDQIDAGTYQVPQERWQRLSEDPRAKQYRAADREGRQRIRSTLSAKTGEDVADIIGAENKISTLPQSEAVQNFGNAPDFGSAWDALTNSPVEVISSLAVESLGQQAPYLPLMAINPALGAGVGSYISENSSDILNSLRESGVDLSSDESIREGLSNRDKMAAFRQHAARRGVAVGLIDALSGGIAGKFTAGAKSAVGKLGRGAVEDLVMQPALGAAGEAAGSLAAGDQISGKDILAEAAGEIGPGAVETTIGAIRHGRSGGAVDVPNAGNDATDTANAETLYLPAPEAAQPDVQPGEILALPPSETTYGDGFTMNEPTPDVVTATPELPSPEQYGRVYGEGFAAGTDLLPPSPGPNYVAMVDRAGRQTGWFDPATAHAVGKELGSFEAARRPVKSIDDIMNDGRSADEIRAELVAQRQSERANADVGSVVKAKLPGQKRAQEVRVVGFTPEGAVVETRAGDKVRLGDDQITLPDQLSFDLEPSSVNETAQPEANGAIEKAATQVETPTQAQVEAGNYRKGHVKVQGLDIAIETPKGRARSGIDPDGNQWSVDMPAHYGYVKGTVGADGDHVDVYLGPNPESDQVYVIDQVDDKTGKFDEHKVMIGYPSSPAAQIDYRKAFSDGKAVLRLGAITTMSMDDFKKWLRSGDTKKPLKDLSRPTVGEHFEPTPLSVEQVDMLKAHLKDKRLSPDSSMGHAYKQMIANGRISTKNESNNFRGALNIQSAIDGEKRRETERGNGPENIDSPSELDVKGDIAKKSSSDLEVEPKSNRGDPDGYISLWDEFSIKVRGQLNLEARIERAHEWLLAKDRETGAEHIVVINHDGSLIAVGTSNSETYVNLSGAAQDAFLLDTNKAFLTHNHPKSHSAHSIGDISILGYPGLDQVQVISASGAIFDAYLGDEGKRLTRNAKVAKAFTIPIQRISKDVSIAISEILLGHVSKGKISRANAEYLYGTILSNTIHRLGVIDFVSNEKGKIDISDIPDLAEQLDQTVILYGEHYKLKTRENSNAILNRHSRSIRKPSEMGQIRSGNENITSDATRSPRGSGGNTELESKPEIKLSRSIDDFGERLEGARKHYTELMKEAQSLDVASVPLSKSWPEPNYEKMLTDGISSDVVSFIRAARDEVPVKPKKSWKLKGWASDVEQLRSFADLLINGEVSIEAVRAKASEKQQSNRRFVDLLGRMELYNAVGHSQSLKGVYVDYSQYSMIDGIKYDPPKGMWSVSKQAKATAFGNWPRQLATGATRQEAIANFKKAYSKIDLGSPRKQVTFTIYRYTRGEKSGKVWIGKKIGRNNIDLKSFDDTKTARAYLAKNHDELVDLLAKYKDIPEHRSENNSPRIGVDHRSGADVSPEQFGETFGFRGVQFGNYVENSRRQQDLNQTYDSLMDLAAVLDVSPKALSLNGDLGLAFGARGKGGKRAALAHYEPGNVVINLTKKNGAGSLAHEWWHALDNYFERKRGKTGYMTEKPFKGYQDPTRPAMIEAFAGIKQAIDSTGISKRAQELDNRRSKQYWTTGREMSARSFESYIIAKLQDQGAANDYLANVVPQDAYGLPEGYPYPLADELPAIRAAFDNFFDTVEQRETDAGVELYSLRQHPARLISVTGAEMGQWKTTGQLRRKAAKHLQDLRGTTIKNADTGLELRITDRGIKHTLSGAGPELLQAVGKIKDIIRVATHIAVEADKRRRPEVKAVHKFETDININNQKFIAHITGYEITDGAIFYDMALGRRGKGASASGTEINDQVRNRITGQTPRNQNIEPKNKKIQSEARTQLEQDVVAEIKRLAPSVKVETRDNGETFVGGTKAEGGYIPVDDLIWTAMDAANPEHVARHEVFHHLRATGRITDAEWSILQRKAKSAWRDKYKVDEYRDQYAGRDDIETLLYEEAVAEAFADWMSGNDRAEVKGGVARIFRKVKEFFDRIASVVRGHGYKSADDVFRTIDAGEAGNRASRDMSGMKRQRDEYFALAGLRRKASGIAGTGNQNPSGLSQAQESAIKRTMANIEDEAPVGIRIRETLEGAVDYLKVGAVQHIFDQFDSIKRYEKATYGELKRASMSAYKMARLTTNLQSTMAAVLRHGPLEYKNGAFQVRNGFEGGFEAIFADLADRGLLKAWKGWAVANRAARLAAEGRENNMTAQDISLLKGLDKQHPEFRDVMKRWTAFNKAMLDMAEQTGLLDPDARALFESDDYVPFYRVLDDQPTGPFSKRGLANQRSGINRLRGGESEVNDLIDNMVRNMTHLVDASMKNVAAKRVLRTLKTAGLDDGSVIIKVPHDAVPVNVTPEQAAQALENIGVQVQGMTKQQHDQWLKLFTLRPPKDPDVVSVMVGGKPQYFRVNDPLLLSSMTSLGTERVNWLVNMLGYPKRWLTTGVTATPGFMLRNFIRDSLHGWVISGEKFTPGLDGFRGAIKSYREDTALVNVMAAGGGSGGFFSTKSRDVATAMAHRGSKTDTVIDTPKKLWHWWHKIGQATENANRLAIYDSVLKETGDVAEAAYQALDIMDFSMRGDSSVVRFMIGTIPFLNARMQGLYRLGRGAKNNPKAFMLRGGLILGASMALYALNKDDDRYDDLPEWEKDAYYHIFLDKLFPKTALDAAGIDPKQVHLRIPKPFEVGALFSTIPERVVRLAQGKDDAGKFGERMTSMFRDTFALDMPQFVKPLAEQWANEVTFTGAPIVPERMQDLKPEAQYDARTSELAKQVGKALPDVFGQAKSPKRIDAAVRAYFGSYGAYVMAIADEALDPIVGNPVEPEMRGDQIPEIGSFIRQDPYLSTRYISEFYDLKSEVDALAQTYKQYRNQGQIEDAKAIAANEPKKLAIASFIRRKARQMSGINKSIRSIEESRSLSAHEKRTQIDQLMETRNKLAKQVIKSLEKNGIK